VLLGLDEFMLRLGHVTVVCEAAASHSGSSGTLQRNVVRRLTKPVRLQAGEERTLAAYFAKKKLCPPANENARGSGEFRYPDLRYTVDGSGPVTLFVLNAPNKFPEVWLQDYLMAQPNVVSRVGGVTVEGKGDSKTGISHVLDWCEILGILSRSARITPIGQIIAGIRDPTGEQVPFNNPYVLGSERLPLAYAYVAGDYEIFSRLLVRLAHEGAKLTRSEAMKLYADSVTDAAGSISRNRNATTRAKRETYDLLKDLQNAAKSSRKQIYETSTCWHRASSRFETLVDLGFLDKGDGKEKEKYEYVYSSTSRTIQASATIAKSATPENWMDDHLVHSLADTTMTGVRPTTADLQRLLPLIVKVLRRPTAPLPVTAVVLAAATYLFADGKPCALGVVRERMMQLFSENPHLARLSGGSRGPNEQFVSINLASIGITHVV
jgi:hypothetical protein